MQSDDTRVPSVDQYVGALLGLACGDALGRPTEGRRQNEIRSLPREELLTFRGYQERRFAFKFSIGRTF